MLYNLLSPFAPTHPVFNLFKYITFRTAGAILTALVISFWLGPKMIKKLKKMQGLGQPIREDGPESHLVKKGTPTMGGILILTSITLSTLLWANLQDPFVWIVLLTTLSTGMVGFVDDYLKVKRQTSQGLSAKLKILSQTIIAACASFFIYYYLPEPLSTQLTVPFFKNLVFDLSYFYIAFSLFIIVGSSNAVNLTDGLDGLAIGPVIIVSFCFAVIAYLIGNAVFANYLQIPFVHGSGELSIVCGALVGAGLGFLWFNAPPAMVFMGDTGSLSMGSALGAISLITKHEIVLGIAGGLFVIEAISVILQVGYFKISKGRRIFLMAPLHHHFEKKGWRESTIVIRFWIISFVLALVALSTLKLR